MSKGSSMGRSAIFGLGVLFLASCGDNVTDVAPITPPSAPDLSSELSTPLIEIFDCVRESGGTLVAAHRGGPKPGFPENTLEAMREGYRDGVRVFEVDVATSEDGVLFLMHDNTLGRTTTSRARVAESTWESISSLSTKDNNGRVTRITPPKLSDVLVWARQTGAIVELDKKPTTSWRNVLSVVRAAEAENNVILITYDDDQAEQVQSLAPEIMLTAGVRGSRDMGALEARGVDPDYVIGWTGTRRPDEAAWRRLREIGIEPAFGTLGRPGDRLDDTYFADGDLSEYLDLAENGVVLLATDKPAEVVDVLSERGDAALSCIN